MLALEHDGPAIYNITDDEPAPLREWLPALADALGATPPRHVPVWLARLIAGDVAVLMGTDARGASNAKAKRGARLDAAASQLAARLRRRLFATDRGGPSPDTGHVDRLETRTANLAVNG